MNLLEILNENNDILFEAIRINNGKEALELIKNNKLGVKLDSSYKLAGEEIISYLDKAINNVGANNAVFAVQLLANKVPVQFLPDVSSSDALKEIVSCKNKPWAKQISGYKEATDFLSKEKYSLDKWHSLEKKLQEEGQKHGKKNKGGGDSGDVINVYDDGTWTLQVPKSFNGAKAASFYGKRGETLKPTGWCTRTNEKYYNHYTKDNTKPMYIIRNWETGKAYQMAIRDDKVDFLDQDDVRGDKITKGDFTDIPDMLLKKIPYGDGENMLDFKQAFEGANQEIKDYRKNLKKIKANSKIKDPTDNPRKALWGKTERVTAKISKNVFLNYYGDKSPKVENPLEKAKGFSSAVLPKKLKSSNGANNGWNSGFISGEKVDNFRHKEWAAKYYYNDDPNNFIIIKAKSRKDIKDVKPELRNREIHSRDRYDQAFVGDWSEVGKDTLATSYDLLCYGYDEDTGKIKKVKDIHALWNYSKHEPKTLALTALKDFGGEKTWRRSESATERKHSEKSSKFGNPALNNKLCSAFSPILNKVFPKSGKWDVSSNSVRLRPYLGRVLPFTFKDEEGPNGQTMWVSAETKEHNINIEFYKQSALHYVVKKLDSYRVATIPEINKAIDNYGREKLMKELEEALNKAIKSYAFDALKDKDLKAVRMNEREKRETYRKGEKLHKSSFGMQFEETNYFPY